jgi:hypothetical protein
MRITRRRVVVAGLLAATLGVSSFVVSRAGGADDTLDDGRVVTERVDGWLRAAEVMPDNGVVAVAASAYGGLTLVKYNADGTLDRAFGGVVRQLAGRNLSVLDVTHSYAAIRVVVSESVSPDALRERAAVLTIRLDGSMVEGTWTEPGPCDIRTARFVSTHQAVAVVGRRGHLGCQYDRLVRFGPSGLDTSYGAGGSVSVSTDARALGVQPDDGAVLVLGVGLAENRFDEAPELLRVSRDGVLDRSFGGSGKVHIVPPGGRLVPHFVDSTPGGRIIIAGDLPGAAGWTLTGSPAIAGLWHDETSDPAFGSYGWVELPVKVGVHDRLSAWDVAVRRNGTMTLAGKDWFAEVSSAGYSMTRPFPFPQGMDIPVVESRGADTLVLGDLSSSGLTSGLSLVCVRHRTIGCPAERN